MREADREPSTSTPRKRASSKQIALRPLIKNILPTNEPGIFPDDIYENLKNGTAREIDGLDPDTVKMLIRAVLKDMHKLGEVFRESARGRNGGSSYKYVRSQSPQADCPPDSHAPSSQLLPPVSALRLDQSGQHGNRSPMLQMPWRWRSDKLDHARDERQFRLNIPTAS